MSFEQHLNVFRDSCLADVPKMRVSQWCVGHLTFDEAGNHGPFRTAGCEYIVDVLDDFGNPDITDEVLVWGSQTKKTGTLMGGTAWAVVNDPCGLLWVMPSISLAKKFSRQRWQKMLKASPPTKNLIPDGRDRHKFATLEQMLGASTLNFVGSNSAANLASNPCRRVNLDEVDKFDAGGREEADAVNLAEQRTKDQVNPQRWKTSTPTLVDGIIWQEFLKGDQRRYFVQCPHCKKEVVFAWSQEFTVLKKLGCEAYIFWDKEAKNADGEWDMEKVRRTAHAKCPHCEKKILDGHKPDMIRVGKWKATASAPVGFVSRHLSSLYATSQETTFGALAVKFLQAQNSLLGLRGFINGDLAEPFMNQDTRSRRVEIITSKIESVSEWAKIMTVDCQAQYFVCVVRAWNGGNSTGIEFHPHVSTWEDLRSIQKAHGVDDKHVGIDSGFGAKSDADVYKNCVRFCEFVKRPNGQPFALGWMPTKGLPTTRRWKDPESGLYVPFYYRDIDPFIGTSQQGEVAMSLFEFASDFFKDILAALRAKKGGYEWSVSEEMATEEYWRHMDGELKKPILNRITGRTTHQWVKRSSSWPNHGLDCEVIQIALANSFGIFEIEENQEQPQEATK